jgi:hypothetical protein
MAGLVLAAGALPLAFLVAVIAGGGHSTPFGHTPAEATLGGALLGVPALLLLLGLAIIRGSFTGRWKLAVAITIIIPVDAAVAALALWQVNRPEPPVSYSPPDPKAVIPGQPVIAVPSCTPDGACTTAPPRPTESAPVEGKRL